MSDDELIEQKRKAYFNAINELQDPQDIIDSLPNLEYKSFAPIMTGLIKMIKAEIAELKNVIAIETDPQDLEIYNDDLQLLIFKLELCEKLLNEYYEVKEEEECVFNGEEKTIIFATTSSGTYFERDLKSIPLSALDDVYDCLYKLKAGIIEADEAKERKFTNNGQLKGVSEKKGYQVRLIYEILANNVIYVIGVRLKKSDNDKKDQEEVIIRRKNTNREFDYLRSAIKDESFKKKLFDTNDETYDRIINMLIEKRGKSDGK